MIWGLAGAIKKLFTFWRMLALVVFCCVLILVLSLMDKCDIRAPWTYDRSPEATKKRLESEEMQQRLIKDEQGNIIGILSKDYIR